MRAILFSLLFVSWAVSAQELAPIPELKARVTDTTGTLSDTEAAALEKKLADFESAKGSQIVVVIVPTTKPEAIEQYGIRLAEQWKIGRKKVDDGAILIVAKNDRRLRIEVGYGLEGPLNDATCKRIIDEQIVPYFKQGKFAEGINSGVDAMLSRVQGEDLPPPAKGAARGDSSHFEKGPLAGKSGPGFGGMAVGLIVAGAILCSFVSRFTSGILVGIGGFLLGWLFLGLGLGVVLGLVAAFATWFLGGSGGGSWSSGGGSWSSGGGGFSGGGGSFGGGGSSGSW